MPISSDAFWQEWVCAKTVWWPGKRQAGCQLTCMAPLVPNHCCHSFGGVPDKAGMPSPQQEACTAASPLFDQMVNPVGGAPRGQPLCQVPLLASSGLFDLLLIAPLLPAAGSMTAWQQLYADVPGRAWGALEVAACQSACSIALHGSVSAVLRHRMHLFQQPGLLSAPPLPHRMQPHSRSCCFSLFAWAAVLVLHSGDPGCCTCACCSRERRSVSTFKAAPMPTANSSSHKGQLGVLRPHRFSALLRTASERT